MAVSRFLLTASTPTYRILATETLSVDARTISELSSDPLYNGDICDIDVGREGGRGGWGGKERGREGLKSSLMAEGMKSTYKCALTLTLPYTPTAMYVYFVTH